MASRSTSRLHAPSPVNGPSIDRTKTAATGATKSMNRSMFLLPLLGLIACDPMAKNAGQVDAVDTDPGEQSTGAAMDSADSGDMSQGIGGIGSPFGLGTIAIDMVASPNGAVVATLTGEPPYDLEVAEYDNDLNEIWSLSLGEGSISELTPLPDGGYVVGGLTETNTAAAWRLSCCGAILNAQEYPTMSGDSAAIIVAQPLAGGVFLVRDDGASFPDLISADLDLVPVSIDPAPGFFVTDGAVTASGNVALTANEGGAAHLLYEIAPDGTGEGVGPGEDFMLVGRGDQLAMMTFSNPDGVNVRDYDSGMVTALNVPDMVTLPERTFAADHREHYAIAHAYEIEEVDQIFTELAYLQGDGTLLRRGLIPAMDAVSRPITVAIADDESIWITTVDTATGTEMLPDMTGVLHRVYLH